jgi:CTP:molybdopterin cytidylyltransferase MocA
VTRFGSRHDRPALVMLAAGMAKRYGGCKPLAPLGVHGEAVIDLTTSDALEAGFGDVVLVLGPQSGPAIRYHVQRCWPGRVPVADVEQTVPLGTAHALLCARPAVGQRPFGVVNADDVYGVEPLATLAAYLSSSDGKEHALVSFALEETIVTADPVTRGTVAAGSDGLLESIAERRFVTRRDDGRFDVGDGSEPVRLDGATPVSMNLWGFRPSIWPVMEKAVRSVHPAVGANGEVTTPPASDEEVLLPEVVGRMVKGRGRGHAVRVLAGTGRCIGITHGDDLPVARTELAELVGRGLRAEWPWESVR